MLVFITQEISTITVKNLKGTKTHIYAIHVTPTSYLPGRSKAKTHKKRSTGLHYMQMHSFYNEEHASSTAA